MTVLGLLGLAVGLPGLAAAGHLGLLALRLAVLSRPLARGPRQASVPGPRAGAQRGARDRPLPRGHRRRPASRRPRPGDRRPLHGRDRGDRATPRSVRAHARLRGAARPGRGTPSRPGPRARTRVGCRRDARRRLRGLTRVLRRVRAPVGGRGAGGSGAQREQPRRDAGHRGLARRVRATGDHAPARPRPARDVGTVARDGDGDPAPGRPRPSLLVLRPPRTSFYTLDLRARRDPLPACRRGPPALGRRQSLEHLRWPEGALRGREDGRGQGLSAGAPAPGMEAPRRSRARSCVVSGHPAARARRLLVARGLGARRSRPGNGRWRACSQPVCWRSRWSSSPG